MTLIYQVPTWFKTSAIVIDLFAVLVCFLIVYNATRYYRFNKHKALFYLAFAFLLMGFATICKAILHSGIYYKFFLRVEHYQDMHYVTTEILPIASLTAYTTFMLIWLTTTSIFMLYLMVRGESFTNTTVWYVALLLIIIAWSNPNPIVFFGMNTLIFLYITYKYIRQYLKTKHDNLLTTVLAFIWLTASQVIFIFSTEAVSYVIAEVMQVIGFFILFIVLLKLGRKKNEKARQT